MRSAVRSSKSCTGTAGIGNPDSAATCFGFADREQPVSCAVLLFCKSSAAEQAAGLSSEPAGKRAI
jgi:hypothetical protein